MPEIEIEAIVTGSRPMDAYGGVRLDDAVLDRIARDLKTGDVPMFIGHDIRRRLNATVLDSDVRETHDGFKEVWVRFRVEATEWHEFEHELADKSAPGGFSFACSEPLLAFEGVNDAAGQVELAADASHWSDDDLRDAAQALRSIGSVTVARRYEFAFEPGAVVVLELVVWPLAISVIGSALYEALKRFVRPDKPTIFQFRVEREGSAVDARLETDDEEALHNAIEAFDQLINPGELLVWDEELGRWRPLN
jgi:hypothetical protein